MTFDFETYSICNPVANICKTKAIWLNGINGENSTSPAIYLRKAKWLSDEDYNEILKMIRLYKPNMNGAE